MTEAYATAIAQLTAERDAALARAEAAEKDRDAAVEARTRARTEADKALGCLQALGRYLGRPRDEGETIDAWWNRLSTTIYEHLPNLYANPKPCDNPHCVPYEAHAKLMGEKEELRRELRDAEAAFAAASQENIRLRAAFETLKTIHIAGVSALMGG